MKKVLILILEIVNLSPIATFFIFFIPLLFIDLYWIADTTIEWLGINLSGWLLLVFIILSILLTIWIRNEAKYYFYRHKQENILKDYHKTITYGIVALVIGFWFARYLVGNPLNGGMILLWGAYTDGFITNTYEDVEGDESGVHYSYTVKYSFRVNEIIYEEKYSRTGKLKSEFSYLEEPYPIEVEYFVYFPSVNRIKGDGAESIVEWFFREFCLGLLFYGLLLFVGIGMIRTGLKEREEALKPVGQVAGQPDE